MATQLSQFQFQANAIRVVVDEHGEPWFLANDVCSVLGYKNTSKAIADHCKQGGVTKRYIGVTTGKTKDGDDATQQVEAIFINEGNLYRLIIKSRKPEAEPFESWVCDEVLPAIRKTGQYVAKQLPEPKTKKALAGGLSLEQQDCIKAMVKSRVENLPKEKQAAAAIRCWSAIKSKFGKSYKAVEPENFSTMVSLIGRVPLEGELLPKQENAMDISLNFPDGVKQLTLAFNAEPALGGRWLVYFSGDKLAIQPISQDEFLTSSAKLPKYIADSMGGAVNYRDLPAIIKAAAERMEKNQLSR